MGALSVTARTVQVASLAVILVVVSCARDTKEPTPVSVEVGEAPLAASTTSSATTSDADLELTMSAVPATPELGAPIKLEVTVSNRTKNAVDAVVVEVPLPPGTWLVSSPPEYDWSTGKWEVGTVVPSGTVVMDLVIEIWTVRFAELGRPLEVWAEIASTLLPDPDSEPGNRVISEDDIAVVQLITIHDSENLPITPGSYPWPPEIVQMLAVVSIPEGTKFTIVDPAVLNYPPSADCPGQMSANWDSGELEVEINMHWPECFGGTYAEWLFLVAHEVCHAHEQQIVLAAGLELVEGNFSDPWQQTELGQAWLSQIGELTNPRIATGSPSHDYTQACGMWFTRRDWLQADDPQAFHFMCRRWEPDSSVCDAAPTGDYWQPLTSSPDTDTQSPSDLPTGPIAVEFRGVVSSEHLAAEGIEGALGYRFAISGVDLWQSYSPQDIDGILIMPESSRGFGQAGTQGPDEITLFMPLDTPPGVYEFGIRLPSGETASVKFDVDANEADN